MEFTTINYSKNLLIDGNFFIAKKDKIAYTLANYNLKLWLRFHIFFISILSISFMVVFALVFKQYMLPLLMKLLG